jgi:hypothetical protein
MPYPCKRAINLVHKRKLLAKRIYVNSVQFIDSSVTGPFQKFIRQAKILPAGLGVLLLVWQARD